MKTKERQKIQIERHNSALQALVNLCGGSSLKITTINSRLRAIEREANRDATDYCNGDIESEQWEQKCKEHTAKVQALFNGKLRGFFVNGDCRGYALKIQDNEFRDGGNYTGIELQKDWGGYGLLAPEITGK